MLAAAPQISGKAGESLRANLDQVRINRMLNAAVRDVELDLGPADLEAQPWDREAMHRVFDALEFRVLRERLLAMVPDEPVETDGFDLALAQLEPGALGPWLAARGGRRLAVDLQRRQHPLPFDPRRIAHLLRRRGE